MVSNGDGAYGRRANLLVHTPAVYMDHLEWFYHGMADLETKTNQSKQALPKNPRPRASFLGVSFLVSSVGSWNPLRDQPHAFDLCGSAGSLTLENPQIRIWYSDQGRAHRHG